MTDRPVPGTIAWHDLTVPDAERLRDFYSAVIGWTAAPVNMGGYNDFTMLPPASEDAVAGVCHARGSNADLPPQWLVYFVVDDVELSADACHAGGGTVLVGPRELGGGRFSVIRDPAGAVCALYQPPESPEAPS
ncbi:MAG: VOC family protein [Gemmatimonadales bacterium]|jgi:hypothetical protein